MNSFEQTKTAFRAHHWSPEGETEVSVVNAAERSRQTVHPRR